jgi:hypothetical protein
VKTMVKIGKWILFEKQQRAEEKFKAGVALGYGGKPKRKTFNVGEHSWVSRCKHFDKYAEDYPLFNQSCLALAGLCTAQGVYYSPAVKKNDETYALAEEAVWRIQKLDSQMRVVSKFYETVYRMAKHGGAFWEVTFSPDFAFRLAPFQEYIEPYQVNELGEVTSWRQIIHGSVAAEWSVEPSNEDAYIVPVMWNTTSTTWPYGTSIGTGLETELDSLIEMESSAKDYMEKQAWPYEVLALGDKDSQVLESDYATARTEWKNRKPGEGIVTRNMPVDIKPGGTGSAPIRELAVLCELMKDNIHDGFSVPPISKLYNSTEASAKVLTAHVMTILGQPIQWIVKEHYEEYVLKPYLESLGMSRKSCPDVLFESPDVHKKEEGDYWVALVQNKIQTPQQACDHLGLEWDEEYWKQEEAKQKEQFQQKQQQQQNQNPQKEVNLKEGTKEWIVRERSHNRSSSS